MKNIIQIILITCLLVSWSTSQKSNIFYYQLSFKKDSLSSKYENDLYILDIVENQQKFYNHEFYLNDSIVNSRPNGGYIFSYPKLDIRLKLNKKGEFIEYFSFTPLYYSLKDETALNWKILDEKKKIREFSVQKATTNFGGRVWEAWFTTEIPLPYGPYKFHGLPGLILEVYDTKNNFIFSFVGSKNLNKEYDTTKFLETQNGISPIEVSLKQMQKIKLDYFLNPLKDFGSGGLIVENERGEKVQADSREIIKKQQHFLRKNNNPIEIDRAVKYPE